MDACQYCGYPEGSHPAVGDRFPEEKFLGNVHRPDIGYKVSLYECWQNHGFELLETIDEPDDVSAAAHPYRFPSFGERA